MMHKHIEKVKFHSAKAPIDIDDVNFDMLVTVQMHFFRYYFGRYSSKLAELVPLPYSRGRSTRHSDRLQDFSVTIPRYYKDVYARMHKFLSRCLTFWARNFTCTPHQAHKKMRTQKQSPGPIETQLKPLLFVIYCLNSTYSFYC